MTKDTISLLSTTYGPFAFGVVSFLAIWFTAVKPELDKRSLDWEAYTIQLRSMEELGRNQQHLAVSLQATAETMQATANVLDGVVSRLEK